MIRIKSISRIAALAVLFASLPTALSADNDGFKFKWSRTPMIQTRTGCASPDADNVEKALGKVKGRTYFAPNGKVYRKGCAAQVAASVLAVQPEMAKVKQVVGYSTDAMIRRHPECELSDMFIDQIMRAVEKVSGKQVDLGIGNFGGIRVDMPKGNILLDDMLSMFPFKNQIVYVAIKGSRVREILEQMAATQIQVIGGARIVVNEGRLLEATIGGKPIEDDKVYGLATISFLLDGGDNLFLAKDAVEVKSFDIDIIDVMLGYVKAETAAGRAISYKKDGRVTVTYRKEGR